MKVNLDKISHRFKAIMAVPYVEHSLLFPSFISGSLMKYSLQDVLLMGTLPLVVRQFLL